MHRSLTKGARAAATTAARVSKRRGCWSVCLNGVQGPAAVSHFSTSKMVRQDSGSNGQARGQPTPLFIQLPGDSAAQLLRVEGEYVGDITKAILVEYQQTFKGVDANQVVLMLADDAARTPLDPTQTLTEAGITARTRLRIEVKAAVADVSRALAPGGQRLSAPGALPYDAALGIPQDVWATMAASAQSAVIAAGQHRAVLTALPALQHLRMAMPAAEAAKLGIEVVRKDSSGNVAAGLFDLPTLSRAVTIPPKTYSSLSKATQKMLVLPQRVQLALEYVAAVETREPDFGVLLSGPNGVGKSGIGLLSYLLCMARSLPVVYISRSEDWVKAASSKDGGGDEFVLKTLWRQNADLVAATPALRDVFAAAIRGEDNPFTSDVMTALQDAVAQADGPRVGVIMDEVQHITKAVSAADLPDEPQEVKRAGRYFATSWHDWTNSNFVFPRMSVASEHGKRDVKLPDGDDHRLRIIEPLDSLDTVALQACSSSPAYIYDPAARERVVYIGGNVLRKLTRAASLLPRTRVPTASELQEMWSRLWDTMVQDCSKWLASLAPEDRDAVAGQVRALVRGDLGWGGSAKPLYDAGIVYRSATSVKVQPVSAVAAAVIFHVTASHVRGQRKDLKLIQGGRQRGFELEEQVLSHLNPINEMVNTKLLDGRPGPALQLRCDYVLPFKELDEVVPMDVPVLYRPNSDIYPCDGILMPADGDQSGAIILIECSTDNPRSSDRIHKVLKWYLPEEAQAPDRVPIALRRRYPSREVVVALCYDEKLDISTVELSLEAVALSKGQLPHPAGSTMSTPSPPGTAAGVTVDGAASQTPAKAGRKGQSTVAASKRSVAGSAARVLDSDSLRSIGLTV